MKKNKRIIFELKVNESNKIYNLYVKSNSKKLSSEEYCLNKDSSSTKQYSKIEIVEIIDELDNENELNNFDDTTEEIVVDMIILKENN